MGYICNVVSLVLVVVVLFLLYGLGYVSGLPKVYRNATEGRLTCEDITEFTLPQQNDHEWRLATNLQGGNRRVFEERIDRKGTECLDILKIT